MHTSLTCHGAAISVVTDSTSFDWIGHYFSSSPGPLAGSWTIDERSGGAWPKRDKTTPQLVEHFRGKHFERFQRERPNHYLLWPTDAQDPAIVVSGSHVRIHPPEGHQPGQLASRAIREIAYRSLLQFGYLPFHAAAASGSAGGCLLVGPSGAGKTSALLALITSGHRYLSNDRAMVSLADRDIRGVGLPVRIGRGSLLACAPLCDYLAGRTLARRGQPDWLRWPVPHDSASLADFDWGGREKAEFSPAELCAATGASLVPHSALRLIVVPRLESFPVQPSLRTASREMALGLMSQELCFPRDPLWPANWLVEADVPQFDSNEMLSELIRSVPVAELSFGIDWFERRHDIAAMLDERAYEA